MKHDHPVTRIISALFAVFILIYIGVQIWRYFYQPVETVTAVYGEVEETILLDGIVVREEGLLHAGDTGAMEFVVDEGERVGKGDLVAGIYADEEAIEVHRKIADLDVRIAKLQSVASQGNALIDIDTVDRAIVETMGLLLTYVENDQVETGAGAADSLKTRVLSREYIKQDKTELLNTISQLKTEREELKKQNQNARKQITADTAGYFSRETDGYESVYVRSQLESLTPAAYLELGKTVAVKPNDDNVIGKIVTNNVWSFAGVVSAEDADRFQVGKSVKLKFEDASYPIVPAKIAQVTVSEDGQALVVMDATVYISQFTVPRTLRAEVVLKTYSGLRVPREALRVNEEEQTGVYCQIDSQVKFKPVETIYETDSYYLVSYDSTNTDGLLLYDEVVVSAKGLEDRKMIK